MNLSPDWVPMLSGAGYDVVHWSDVGRPDAPDDDILLWARAQHRTVFTNDLDFGAALATSGASAPSVVQLRTATTLASRLGLLVLRVLRETEIELSSGAIVTISDDRVRLRPLAFTTNP